MEEILTRFVQLGIRRNAGAEPSHLDRVESVFAVKLPEDFRAFYLATDGLDISELGIELLSLTGIEQFSDFPDELLGYLPFGDCNDSNPYSLCFWEPIVGFVVHLWHDNGPDLTCRSFTRFLEMVLDRLERIPNATEQERDTLTISLNHLGDYSLVSIPRGLDDAQFGRELIRYSERFTSQDHQWLESLCFATQLFGAGNERELSHLLEVGNGFVHRDVLRRCQAVGTPEAIALQRDHTKNVRLFIDELATVLTEAGIEIRRDNSSGYRFVIVQGNIYLAFEMLYCERNKPAFHLSLIERIRGWQKR